MDCKKVITQESRLFEAGLQPQVQYLYPKVQFPVSLGTPMISSKIKWQHSRSFFTPTCETKIKQKQRRTFDIDLNDSHWAAIEGHNIDGKTMWSLKLKSNLRFQEESSSQPQITFTWPGDYWRTCWKLIWQKLRWCLRTVGFWGPALLTRTVSSNCVWFLLPKLETLRLQVRKIICIWVL